MSDPRFRPLVEEIARAVECLERGAESAAGEGRISRGVPLSLRRARLHLAEAIRQYPASHGGEHA